MKRMAVVIAAALAIMPVAGGLAVAKPSDNPSQQVYYSGSANRENCRESHRQQLPPRKVTEVKRETVTNKDGSKSREVTYTTRLVPRPVKVYMVCGY